MHKGGGLGRQKITDQMTINEQPTATVTLFRRLRLNLIWYSHGGLCTRKTLRTLIYSDRFSTESPRRLHAISVTLTSCRCRSAILQFNCKASTSNSLGSRRDHVGCTRKSPYFGKMADHVCSSPIIRLNIGGVSLATKISILCPSSHPHSLVEAL